MEVQFLAWRFVILGTLRYIILNWSGPCCVGTSKSNLANLVQVNESKHFHYTLRTYGGSFGLLVLHKHVRSFRCQFSPLLPQSHHLIAVMLTSPNIILTYICTYVCSLSVLSPAFSTQINCWNSCLYCTGGLTEERIWWQGDMLLTTAFLLCNYMFLFLCFLFELASVIWDWTRLVFSG